MDNSEVENSNSPPEEHNLNRNRSFKSKQLVRSQAITESHSPPRTISPLPKGVDNNTHVIADNDRTSYNSLTANDYNVSDSNVKMLPVEIQITPGDMDSSVQPDTTDHTMLSQHSHECDQCPQASQKSKRQGCPTKQDSGIVCSEDCIDCSDSELSGDLNSETLSKSENIEQDLIDQHNICRCTDRKDKPKNIAISRTDSDDKSDLTGIELVNFIKVTLNKNPRDRATLIRIEKELHALIHDDGVYTVRFPSMTSYGRMLVHRCAALFKLAHRLDHNNKGCVVVSKTATLAGSIPTTNFKQWCTVTFPQSPRHMPQDTQAKSILKRNERSGCGRLASAAAARSKSLEQREKDYERVRRRIFSTDNCTQEDPQWPWLSGPVKLLTPDTGRNKLLKVQSLEGNPNQPRYKGAVSKSHSFGGYGGEEPAPRLLSRQGDLASSSWRLSPSSSGYKTLSMRSTDSITPSPTDVLPTPAPSPALVWAVTDLARVPRGALIIHPQTGRPLSNPDGSVYRYDPSNPPLLCDATYCDGVDENNEKKRGRLEKQNSFIDNEFESHNTGECEKNCCCDYGEENCDNLHYENQQPHESPQEILYETPNNIEEQKTFEQTNDIQYEEQSNHIVLYEETTNEITEIGNEVTIPTNQKTAVVEPTNQRAVECNLEKEEKPNDYQQSYVQFRNEEVVQTSSPHQGNQNYVQTDIQNVHVKNVPMPVHDHSIRGVPISNMMYTAPPPPYHYTNQCRMDPQQIYPANLPLEEVKPAQEHEPFRIDSSYPYAPIEPYASFAAQPCVENAQRTYGLTYAPTVDQTMLSGYPLNNVMVPQPVQQFPVPQYQHIPWQGIQPLIQSQMQSNCATPIQKPTSPNMYIPEIPLTYHPQQMYNQNQLYPMLQYQYYPQNYVQQIPYVPVYPVIERKNSFKYENLSNSSRNTPIGSTPPVEEKKVPYDRDNRSYQEKFKRDGFRQNELAMKIEQIKEQMANMNTQEKGVKSEKKMEDFRGRKSGNGILGSYPNSRVAGRPINDESQLSSAARAIVNSIRNMQAKTNNYNQERRYQENRNENRFRPRDDREDRTHHYQDRTHHHQDRPVYDRTQDRTGNNGQDRQRLEAVLNRHRPINVPVNPYRPYMVRQMTPGAWCRRSPAPLNPGMHHPRRPPPDTRNQRRQ